MCLEGESNIEDLERRERKIKKGENKGHIMAERRKRKWERKSECDRMGARDKERERESNKVRGRERKREINNDIVK